MLPRDRIRSTRGSDSRRALLFPNVQLFASDFVVPVDARSVRIVAPCPDMQFKEVRKLETIGCSDELEVLTIECRRGRVVLHPGSRVDDVFNTDELARVADGLIDQG